MTIDFASTVAEFAGVTPGLAQDGRSLVPLLRGEPVPWRHEFIVEYLRESMCYEAMIDLHYGHLAVDSYQHAVSLLDALALERAVDAGWTPARKPAKPYSDTVSGPHRRHLSAGGGRSVDAEARSRR